MDTTLIHNTQAQALVRRCFDKNAKFLAKRLRHNISHHPHRTWDINTYLDHFTLIVRQMKIGQVIHTILFWAKFLVFFYLKTQ